MSARQPAADGQAQARAFVLARQAGVNLAERLEELVQVLRLDADAGVGHAKADCGSGAASGERR